MPTVKISEKPIDARYYRERRPFTWNEPTKFPKRLIRKCRSAAPLPVAQGSYTGATLDRLAPARHTTKMKTLTAHRSPTTMGAGSANAPFNRVRALRDCSLLTCALRLAWDVTIITSYWLYRLAIRWKRVSTLRNARLYRSPPYRSMGHALQRCETGGRWAGLRECAFTPGLTPWRPLHNFAKRRTVPSPPGRGLG